MHPYKQAQQIWTYFKSQFLSEKTNAVRFFRAVIKLLVTQKIGLVFHRQFRKQCADAHRKTITSLRFTWDCLYDRSNHMVWLSWETNDKSFHRKHCSTGTKSNAKWNKFSWEEKAFPLLRLNSPLNKSFDICHILAFCQNFDHRWHNVTEPPKLNQRLFQSSERPLLFDSYMTYI